MLSGVLWSPYRAMFITNPGIQWRARSNLIYTWSLFHLLTYYVCPFLQHYGWHEVSGSAIWVDRIKIRYLSCHHHWLFWDLNPRLTARKSCFLTAKPRLLPAFTQSIRIYFVTVTSQKAKAHYDSIAILGQTACQSEGTVHDIGKDTLLLASSYSPGARHAAGWLIGVLILPRAIERFYENLWACSIHRACSHTIPSPISCEAIKCCLMANRISCKMLAFFVIGDWLVNLLRPMHERCCPD